MRSISYKYFLYARKSSESEDRQIASIEDQIAEARKMAERYELKVVDIISESKSAKEPGRLGFDSMLDRIQKGEAQGILTWKLNRLARNPIDGGRISWMLQQNILKHIQTFERDYNPEDNVLLMQVEFGMANQYVKDLSIDVKRGMRQKAERGWYPISQLPVGYTHNQIHTNNSQREIIPDNPRFKLLGRLWNLMLTGKYPVSAIRRQSIEMGFRNNRGKFYSKSFFYHMFSKEFYCGYYYWPDKDGNLQRYHGKHQPMVTPQEFQKIQGILKEKVFSKAKERFYDFPYRGIIKCGECGAMVTPDHKQQVICTKCKYKFSSKNTDSCPKCGTRIAEMKNPSVIDILYYHCTRSKGQCSQKYITIDEIEKTLLEELEKISISREQYNWAVNQLAKVNDLKSDNSLIIADLSRKKNNLEKRLEGLIGMRADGEISKEQFNNTVKNIHQEIACLNCEIEDLKNQDNIIWEQKSKGYEFMQEVAKRFQNGDKGVKMEIVKELQANLILRDKRLYLSMQKPYEELKSILRPKQ